VSAVVSKPQHSVLGLEHGLCVLMRWPDGDPDKAGLHPEERAFAAALPSRRRPVWAAGRLALRAAIERAGLTCDSPILSTGRGAPLFPAGIAGSLSHKQSGGAIVAAALVAPGDEHSIGIDVEIAVPPVRDIGPKILTPDEAAQVQTLPPDRRRLETLLRFSLKEAIYKAVDPLLRRSLRFTDIAVTPLPGGAADLDWRIPTSATVSRAEAQWDQRDGLVIATARARRVSA
jgi:4'-phosphopantetheinyl transferase EntD